MSLRGPSMNLTEFYQNHVNTEQVKVLQAKIHALEHNSNHKAENTTFTRSLQLALDKVKLFERERELLQEELDELKETSKRDQAELNGYRAINRDLNDKLVQLKKELDDIKNVELVDPSSQSF